MDKNIKFDSGDLVLIFEKFLVNSNYLILSLSRGKTHKNFYDCIIKKENTTIIIHFSIKNIGSAFLPYDPTVLRIQTGPIDSTILPENTKNEISLLIGVCKNDNYELLAFWNPFYFVGHKTNRSCYLSDESFKEAIINGKSIGFYSDVPVYLTSIGYFDEVFNQYIEENKI